MTTSEVAERLRVDPNTVRRWVARGQIPRIMLPGGLMRFRREDIDAMEGYAEPPAAEVSA